MDFIRARNIEIGRFLSSLDPVNAPQGKVDGYTDVWGNYQMNTRIADLRAENVIHILMREGLEESSIEKEVNGESKPVGDCKLQYPCSINDRKQNRRVELRIMEQ